MIFGSIFDLQLSKAIVDMNDPIANFYETYGLWFAHAEIEVIIVMIFVGLYKREKLPLKILGYVVLVVANLVLIYIFHKFFWLNPNSKEILFGFRYSNRILVIILSALSLIAVGVLTFFVLNKDNLQDGVSFSLQYIDSMTNEYIQEYTIKSKYSTIEIECGYPQLLGQ